MHLFNVTEKPNPIVLIKNLTELFYIVYLVILSVIFGFNCRESCVLYTYPQKVKARTMRMSEKSYLTHTR